ncbi:dihydroorotase [bacterium]|nr:dihydroorotase [bacterium]
MEDITLHEPVAITGAAILDLETGERQSMVICLLDNHISEITSTLPADFSGRVIDFTGSLIVPGLFDMHVHFRDPGFTHKETLSSGLDAAAAGGFTRVCTMPNTRPTVDNSAVLEDIHQRSRGHLVEICQSAAITLERAGERLTDFKKLKSLGAVAFSDDGNPVVSPKMMMQALELAAQLDVPVLEHCEEPAFFTGPVHQGDVALKLGVDGIPGLCEELMIARNILLAEASGGHFHAQHVSTARSVALIRQARANGISVTAEAAPHHFIMDHNAILEYGTNAKMNPPLRTAADVSAVRQGLAKGVIDVIASDHAPHTAAEKARSLEDAPFGIVGIETMLPLTLTHLVKPGHLSLAAAIQKLAIEPARILRQPVPVIETGGAANLTLLNPDISWKIDVAQFKSKSVNCPYDGWPVQGMATGVVHRGHLRRNNSTKNA